jgi:hypothetical protein
VRIAYKISIRKPEGKTDNMEDVGIDDRHERIFEEKWDCKEWTRFGSAWDKMQ